VECTPTFSAMRRRSSGVKVLLTPPFKAIRYGLSKRIAIAGYVGRAASVLKVRMETNDETRKRRLRVLCDMHGGVRQVAQQSGIAWATLDQILKGTLLPAKADGTRSPRSLGDANARAIEEAFKLGRGWFDWPFDAVDFRAYESLDELERGAVQGAMNAAIKDIAERKAKAVLRKMGAKKEAASNRLVEERMPITRRKTNFNLQAPELNDGSNDVRRVQNQEDARSSGGGRRTSAKR